MLVYNYDYNYKLMGVCKSKKIYPSNNKIVLQSWKIISEPSFNINVHKFPIIYFNDTFFDTLDIKTDSNISILNWNIQINIIEHIILLLTENNKQKIRILLKKLKNIFIIEQIDETSYRNIQESISTTIQTVLGDKCTDSVLQAWDNNCKHICMLLKDI